VIAGTPRRRARATSLLFWLSLAPGCAGSALVGTPSTGTPGANDAAANDAGANADVSAADPLTASPRCTSGLMWTNGYEASERMQPGEPCIACHVAPGPGGPKLAYGGTVYPTGHEPSQCYGANGRGDVFGAKVVLVDGLGMTYTADVNSVGNFYVEADDALMPPIKAKVVYDGRERAMVMAAPSADCNTCHTQEGTTTVTTANAPKAPGRIVLP
jgi:hypothetical protein